ncbi:ricin-type beta-trefoil lectin domain protein [Kitasatospora sp. NPDC057904]|uniref:ricin-type beta-trefoil lectin domain protein n=1 Tax=Kitasatospora sp. NPDC057904 TaxID=3346275 RepID=UPI0036D8767C
MGLMVAIPVIAGSVPAVTASAADAVAPAVVEDYSYPGAAKVLADHNVTLKAGDGHIVLADCASGPGLVQLYSRAANPSEVCFRITGSTGYLSLEIPQVYNIRGDDHTIKATLNTAGTVTSVAVNKNDWTPVGEGGTSGSTTLLELNATDGPAATAPAGTYPAVGTLTVGQAGHPGSRACTATLVAPQWVLSAAACVAGNPADPTTAPTGLPRTRTTAAVGGHTVEVTEFAPRADRDLVMARLAAPVYDVTPIAVSTAAPTAGEDLTVAGFGRTASAWVPNAPHSAALTVSALSAAGADLAAKTAADTVCKGDSGAPALRTENGKPAVAAVTSRAWQGGCLGTDPAETRTGASEARVDDLASWIGGLVNRAYQVVNPGSGRCVNVSGAGPWTNGNPIILFDCVPGAGNEAYQLTASGQLRTTANGQCLNVAGAGPWANGNPIILWDCVPGAGNETFQLTASGQLYNPASDRCLNVSGAGPTWANSTPMILWQCVAGQANETFALASADKQSAGPTGAMLNPASNRCLNVWGAGPWDNGNAIVLWDCAAGQANEQFQLTASGQLVNPASNRCLNVSGAGPTWDNSTPIILWQCVPGAANETFRVTADGQFLNPASGRCLNVAGAGPTWDNNNRIILFDCVPGAGNEKFVSGA